MPALYLIIVKKINYFVEHFGNALIARTYGRHNGNANHFAERFVIELMVFGQELVVHIQSHHHLYVHVNQLGG